MRVPLVLRRTVRQSRRVNSQKDGRMILPLLGGDGQHPRAVPPISVLTG
ncbi:MAG: hypothetical protein JWM68_1623 [Verrucomicrobiales bacterium]|nr:hypothetical protein [Verrucomicrobiales bacterium]